VNKRTFLPFALLVHASRLVLITPVPVTVLRRGQGGGTLSGQAAV
jgi:hypothetical protein